MKSDRPLARMFAEGLVIVVSVLLALSADAWWAGREDRARGSAHVASLSRDFTQMAQRVDSSMFSARRGAESARALLSALAAEPGTAATDSAQAWLLHALDFEAFSPSLGAYEAITSSGDLELLDDQDLRVALGEFFGSFEDVRISERVLVEHQLALTRSPDFERAIGFHRIVGYPDPDRMRAWRRGVDLPADRVQLGLLAESDEFLSRLTALALYQGGVLIDYEYLHQQISVIQSLLRSPGVAAAPRR